MTRTSGTTTTATDQETGGERCVVLHPHLKAGRGRARAPEARLAEIEGLARAINLSVAHGEVVQVPRARPATLLGSGTVSRLASLMNTGKIDVVVIDTALSPVQQRNLERAWKCKVVDRTGLILEIFGARARTREGTLQVELAALTYQRSRLVRSWTHLERQRGGFGFMGGPGEAQIETDRRLIDQRIDRLRRDLAEVKRTRTLHREARRRVPYAVVALVGYTNAGKSTLFNTLTNADVTVQNQLFATLDPTMRGVDLPSGRTVILSDTVGFISDLPHELVAAFQATLEEVCEADVIVHVRDSAHPDSEAQKSDVQRVLGEMGLDEVVAGGLIEVLNKIDVLPPVERENLAIRALKGDSPMVPVSALSGEGCATLAATLDERLAESWRIMDVALDFDDGETHAWLHRHGEVLEQRNAKGRIHLRVRLNPADAARFNRRRKNKREKDGIKT